MSVHEIGRWPCDKCGKLCVAAGIRIGSFPKNGSFVGACPWGCGALIRRGFRSVPGTVDVYTSEQWHQFAVAGQVSRMAAG